MAKKSNTLAARKIVSYAEVIGNRHLIRATVGPRNDLLLLSLESDPDDRSHQGDSAFRKLRADHGNRFSIHFQAGDDWIETRLPETMENYHYVQPLGTDQWLVARARSDGDDDPNAHILDACGYYPVVKEVGIAEDTLVEITDPNLSSFIGLYVLL